MSTVPVVNNSLSLKLGNRFRPLGRNNPEEHFSNFPTFSYLMRWMHEREKKSTPSNKKKRGILCLAFIVIHRFDVYTPLSIRPRQKKKNITMAHERASLKK